jgi:hypothetical protein
MEALKIIALVVVAPAGIGIIVNFKDIARYIHITRM